MSNNNPTVDQLRIGGSVVCVHCGLPKPASDFEEGSISCRVCAPRFLKMQRAQVTAEDLTKTAYQLALEQLQNNATPTIPGGVQKAHRILKKSSSEIIADALKRQLEGLDKGLPINERLIKELALGLQKAEIEHDAAMKGQGNVFAGMTTEQLTSIMLDRALTEMIESEAMRKKILGILLQRVPTFYAEILELAKVTIVEAQST